jgi:N-acetylglucosaminyl-diphospho-decaprenol L-rhamnosyltransferase
VTYAQVTISIVSHGHGHMLEQLLPQLAACSAGNIARVVVTLNAPVLDAKFLSNNRTVEQLSQCFDLVWLVNPQPKGFGANHNTAFTYCNTPYFCVLNPDIDLGRVSRDGINEFQFSKLCEAIAPEQVGLAYPKQVTEHGNPLDFERELVTPLSLLERHFIRHVSTTESKHEVAVQWVSGSFMMFKSPVFRSIGGFDEDYFMYCEDVDICIRIQLVGYRLVRADTTVIHHTQRQTLKDPKHLAWHMRSLLRLWNSATYKEFKQKLINYRN